MIHLQHRNKASVQNLDLIIISLYICMDNVLTHPTELNTYIHLMVVTFRILMI